MRSPLLNTLQLVANTIVSRASMLRKWMDPRRDIDTECGHPDSISIEDYRKAFDRRDIAGRVIRIFPDDCWQKPPEIYETEDEEETEFEAEWKALQKRLRLYSVLRRADVLSGIGRFGIILLGIDDGLPLDQPIAALNERGEAVGTPAHKLLYVRPFDESYVKVKKLESDPGNPRYGQPISYEIQFATDQFKEGVVAAPQQGTLQTTTQQVHWTRVIHLADNRTSDDVFGTPRLRSVYNRVLDLQKIAGGSGEMFWKGGFPGLGLETHPSDEPLQVDTEALKEEVTKYADGLQRWLILEGMSAKTLAPNISDPTAHAELQIRLICIALGVPWRVFMGAEVGQLASGQDIIAWNGKLMQRREEYVSPFVIRPFIDRLILLGVLPKPTGGEESPENQEVMDADYIIHWDDLNTPSAEQIATVAEKQTNALAKYVAGNLDQIISPKHFHTLVMKFSEDEAESIIEEVGDRILETDPDADLERDVERAERMAEVQARFQSTPNPSRNGK